MTTKIKRKPNTALVINPNRGLSLKGRTVRRSARKNPVKASAARSVRKNPFRRRVRKINPITSATSLIVAAVMGGLGLSAFDVVVKKTLPANLSPYVRIGVKAGGAFLINSYGSKVPVLGSYKNEIALLILGSAAIDVMNLLLFPLVAQAAAQFGLAAAPQPQLIPAGTSAQEMAGNVLPYEGNRAYA